MKSLLVKVLGLLPWKAILRLVWSDIKPKIEAKVLNSDPKWDDVAYKAICLLADRFLKDE